MKNKIINLSVAVTLIIVCIFSFITNGDYSIAGAGNGKNARIETIKDFSEVLEFLNPNSNKNRVVLTSARDSDEDHKNTSKYNSATVRITTSIKTKYKSTNATLTQGVKSSTQSLERELTCYMTEQATYYVSKGVSREQIYYLQIDNSNEMIVFDMEILVTKENCFIKFHEFSLVSNEISLVIKPENKNIWIDMPYELVEGFIDVDIQNREVFASFGEMFDFLREKGKINEFDTSVSFNEKALAEIFEEAGNDALFDPEYYDINFEVDLSSPTRPSMSINSCYENIKNKQTGTIENKIKNDQTIMIYNINNTVIKWKDSYVDKVIESADGPEEIFYIEKYEEGQK